MFILLNLFLSIRIFIIIFRSFIAFTLIYYNIIEQVEVINGIEGKTKSSSPAKRARKVRRGEFRKVLFDNISINIINAF